MIDVRTYARIETHILTYHFYLSPSHPIAAHVSDVVVPFSCMDTHTHIPFSPITYHLSPSHPIAAHVSDVVSHTTYIPFSPLTHPIAAHVSDVVVSFSPRRLRRAGSGGGGCWRSAALRPVDGWCANQSLMHPCTNF
jgi:hypothetical protein